MIAFGPVPSRRFGKSLGINNISSAKACSYSCLYCQLGRTKEKTSERRTFYDPQTLYKDVCRHLLQLGPLHVPDCLTLVPNGEPTLDRNLGEEIKLLKKLKFPVGVITNASLLSDPGVREELMHADRVCIKVDTLREETWQVINRPSHDLDFQQYLQGLKAFASTFKGKLYTETMLVSGINDSETEVNLTGYFLSKLRPVVSYLLTPTRPPAEKNVSVPSKEKLYKVKNTFEGYGLLAELLYEFEGNEVGVTGNAYEDILNISAVHPIREDTMEKILQDNRSGEYVLDSLVKEDLIKPVVYHGNKYFVRHYHN